MSIPYHRATYNAKGAAPGTEALLEAIKRTFSNVHSLGIYNYRSIRGSDNLSLHAEGRAVDVAASDIKSIADWAVRNAQQWQIQEVIDYPRKRIWTSNKADKGFRPYGGKSAGYKHVHIGQNRIGAATSRANELLSPTIILDSYFETFEELGIGKTEFAIGMLALSTWAGIELYASQNQNKSLKS